MCRGSKRLQGGKTRRGSLRKKRDIEVKKRKRSAREGVGAEDTGGIDMGSEWEE
jgi:hypothetical protein